MKQAEELMVLVDDDDRVIGEGGKLDVHRRGALHRAHSVIVWDSDGRLLLQKRNARKYHSGGLWTNACCGHPRPGEEVLDAAVRRLGEEMGFTCRLEPLGTIRYRADLDDGMIEHELVHIYRGLYDGPVAPDPFETEGYQWAGFDQVKDDVAAMPQRFSAWFRQYVDAQWPMALARPLNRKDRAS